MSPLSRDRLEVAVAPGRLQLQRRAAAWRGGGAQAAAIVDCAAAAPDDDAPTWAPLLTALRDSLRDPQWAGCAATVLLSDHWVRYLLIPWDEQLVTDEEQEAMVRHAFVSAYGTPAEHWSFRRDVAPPPSPCLASAVDEALLGGLREVFAESSLALASIQPRLMAAFNDHRRALPAQGGYWFIAAEPGRITLLRIDDDVPSAVYSQRVGADWAEALPELLARGLLLAGAGSAPGEVYLSLEADRELPGEFPRELPGGWSLHPLPPKSAPAR